MELHGIGNIQKKLSLFQFSENSAERIVANLLKEEFS